MLQLQCRRMQKISWQRNASFVFRAHLAWRPIERVAHDGMPQRSQMHPDLVSPPGIDPQFEQRELSVLRINPLLHGVVRDRFSPAGTLGSHAGPPHPVAADAAADRSPILLDPPVHQRNICFLDYPPCELSRQLAMGFVIFGDHDQPACGLVQTVHNSWSQLPTHTRELPEAMQQRIHQRPTIALVLGGTRASMHHHPSSLVHHRQIVVLVNDVQRDFLSHRPQRSRFHLAENRNPFSSSQAQRSFRRIIIDQNFLFVDQLLDASTTGVDNLADQELVQPLARILVRRNKSLRECVHAQRKCTPRIPRLSALRAQRWKS